MARVLLPHIIPGKGRKRKPDKQQQQQQRDSGEGLDTSGDPPADRHYAPPPMPTRRASHPTLPLPCSHGLAAPDLLRMLLPSPTLSRSRTLHAAHLQSSITGWLRAGALLRTQPQLKQARSESTIPC